MVLLTLGTGVGGGAIVDGELVNGVNSFGSECGHMIVDPSPTARLCVWGGRSWSLGSLCVRQRRSCSEPTHCSAKDEKVLWPVIWGGNDSELTAKRVYEAALADDELALEIIDETAYWLGVGITSIIHLLDPGGVVLGGAMNFGGANCKIGQRFLERICEEFKRRTFDNVYQGTTIKFAVLGGDAGYLGVAGYARHEHQKRGSAQVTQ